MDRHRGGHYYSGTSGLVLPVKNKSFYPPEFQDKSRLAYYSSLFNSIEINSTFYKVPRQVTMQKWADSVAENFHFTFKMWQGITHMPNLIFDPEMVAAFMDSIQISNGKKGCILVQFPKSLKFSALLQLKRLIKVIRENDKERTWKADFEFRDPSWYRDDTFRMLEEEQCGMVFHDKSGSFFSADEFETNHVYLRFHGPKGNYRGSYEDELLYEFSGYIVEWLRSRKDVYAYFNNTMGDAVKNLMLLDKYVRERVQ